MERTLSGREPRHPLSSPHDNQSTLFPLVNHSSLDVDDVFPVLDTRPRSVYSEARKEGVWCKKTEPRNRVRQVRRTLYEGKNRVD